MLKPVGETPLSQEVPLTTKIRAEEEMGVAPDNLRQPSHQALKQLAEIQNLHAGRRETEFSLRRDGSNVKEEQATLDYIEQVLKDLGLKRTELVNILLSPGRELFSIQDTSSRILEYALGDYADRELGTGRRSPVYEEIMNILRDTAQEGHHDITQTPSSYVRLSKDQLELIREAVGHYEVTERRLHKSRQQSLKEVKAYYASRQKNLEELNKRITQAQDQADRLVSNLNRHDMELWQNQMGRPFKGTERDFVDLWLLRFKSYGLQQENRAWGIGIYTPAEVIQIEDKGEIERGSSHWFSDPQDLERTQELKQLHRLLLSETWDLRHVLLLRPPDGFMIRWQESTRRESYRLDERACLWLSEERWI